MPAGPVKAFFATNKTCPVVAGVKGTGACAAFTCSVGPGASDCASCEAPPLTGFDRCASCNVGSERSVDGGGNATCACAPGFFLVPAPAGGFSTCAAFSCILGPGSTQCKTCSPTGEGRCGSCNNGEFLRAYKCTANGTRTPCATGTGATDCAGCPDEETTEVTGPNQCSVCNPGSERTPPSAANPSPASWCTAFTCTASAKVDECSKCVRVPTAHNQCDRCNKGSFKNTTGGYNCVPYTCQTGGGKDQCKTCVAQGAMTANDQCATCNDGAQLDGANQKCRDGLCRANHLDPSFFAEEKAVPQLGTGAENCNWYENTCCPAAYGDYVAQFVEQMRLGNSLGRQNESYFERGIPSVVRASPKHDGCRRALNTCYCFWCSPQVRMCVCVCVCVCARARVCMWWGGGE